MVEDDTISANALRLILSRQGWTVAVAGTLAEANAYLDGQMPDTIILDLMLPDGEGISVLKRVRDAGLAVRVAVTTAASDPFLLTRVQALVPHALLKKPLEISDLLSKI
ncbi:MAG: response regulator transcription factor [Phycisphaerales bacterium]|nr:response regulator transcription factor [Phycisphaerales bacterium]